jgi:hypothetical protein
MTQDMPYGARLVAVLLIAIVLLYRSLPGALLCLVPGGMRQHPEPLDENPPESDPEPIRLTVPALEALGFTRLGLRTEKPLLGKATLSWDFVHHAEKSYASLYLVDRRTRRLYFLTPYDGGALVLTADHKRPGAVQDGYYLAGGLPGATPDQLWAAHKRQMTAMEDTGRERVARATIADRMDAARAWFSGVGKREVRVRNATPALLTVLALFILVSGLSSLPAALRARANAPTTRLP